MNVFSQIVIHGFVFFCFRIASSYCSTLMLNPTLHWNMYFCMSCGEACSSFVFYHFCCCANFFASSQPQPWLGKVWHGGILQGLHLLIFLQVLFAMSSLWLPSTPLSVPSTTLWHRSVPPILDPLLSQVHRFTCASYYFRVCLVPLFSFAMEIKHDCFLACL